MNFSVLLSVYALESDFYLEQALNSIWHEQSLKPSEIILVKDGPVTDELNQVINKYQSELGDVLKIISLDENKGLAYALNVGIKYCSYPYIARMDTDDVSTKDRFLKQITFLMNNPDIDVVGCAISEIDENNVVIKDCVQYPLTHQDLYQFFSKRDPLAHPTAVFRHTFFEKVGKYREDVPLAEDTLLWYEAFKSNCKFANIPDIGLLFRRTNAFYRRRSNWNKSKSLLKFRLLYINRDLGYGVMADLYALAYFGISLMPSIVKKFLYRFLR